ncbi:MAG: FdhC protein [Clostridiales bacterium]|nr:MAG: FdhC protein [Clostridiales bacterium]
MENLFLSPGEIAQSWIGIGKKKANLAFMKTLLLAIIAGMFIGLGAHADIIAVQTLGETVDVGFAKLIGASVFPVGIILVVIAGAELFTGNCLIALSVINRDEKIIKLVKNLIVVFIGNFIGAVALAYLLSNSGLYGPDAAAKAVAIAEGKIALTPAEAVIRAIFCNVLVVMAVWMQAGAKDISGKILAMWFPVMLFVLSGFEHSIANLFFIPLGIFLGADISWLQMWIANILPVTIGNIIGGAILMPAVYWYVYVYESKKAKRKFAA